MLDISGALVIGATAAVLLAALAATLPVRLEARLAVGAIAGAWIALVVVIAASGGLKPIAAVPLLFAAPLVTAALLALAFPPVRAALLSLPISLVISLNVFRVLGFQFLLLAAVGRLAGPFPYFAGIGDILTGLMALRVAGIASRTSAGDRRVLAWNAFGMLDLLVAVALGVTSQPQSPLQLIHAGIGTATILTLPWCLIPLVLVPTYLIGHGVVFAQARREGREAKGRAEVPHSRAGWMPS